MIFNTINISNTRNGNVVIRAFFNTLITTRIPIVRLVLQVSLHDDVEREVKETIHSNDDVLWK